MTTLLNFLREARSRLGRAWDLLVTGEDPEAAAVDLDYDRLAVKLAVAEGRVRDLEALKVVSEERARTIATIRAAVSNAP